MDKYHSEFKVLKLLLGFLIHGAHIHFLSFSVLLPISDILAASGFSSVKAIGCVKLVKSNFIYLAPNHNRDCLKTLNM